MNSIPQSFYVYTLINSLTDRVFYVGKGYANRMDSHEREARRDVKSYKCNTIRKIWRQGGEVIKQKVAEFIDEQDAFIYEWCLINLIYGRKNLTNGSDGGEGARGVEYTPEQMERRIEGIRKAYANPLVRQNAREAITRQWREHPEKREAQGQRSKQMWSDPEFQRLQKIRNSAPEVVARKRESGKKVKNFKTFDGFVAPDGTVYAPITNLISFCREHGLLAGSMYQIDKGIILSYKGWTRINPRERRPPAWKPLSRQVNLMSPDGTIYSTIDNVAAFCRDHGLDRISIFRLLKGRYHHHKGWTRYNP